MGIDAFIDFGAARIRVEYNFGGILISYLATSTKLGHVASTARFDPTLDRASSRDRVQEVDSALFSYRAWLTESTLLALSNAFEDLSLELKQTYRYNYHLWNSPATPIFVHNIRIVRSLGNVIKHDRGIISRFAPKSGQFLVDAGFTEGAEVRELTSGASPAIDVERLIYRCYLFCSDLLGQVAGKRPEILDVPEPERSEQLFDHFVPPALGLSRTSTAA